MSQTYDAVAENGQIILRCIRRDPAARRDIDTLDTFEPEEAEAFRQSLHGAIETARSQREHAPRRMHLFTRKSGRDHEAEARGDGR